jgi:hypothetical protein
LQAFSSISSSSPLACISKHIYLRMILYPTIALNTTFRPRWDASYHAIATTAANDTPVQMRGRLTQLWPLLPSICVAASHNPKTLSKSTGIALSGTSYPARDHEARKRCGGRRHARAAGEGASSTHAMYQFQAGRHHHVPTATSTGRQEERGRENGEVTGEDTEVQEVASPVRSQERRQRRCGSAMWSGDVVLSSPQMFLPSGSYRLVHLHSVVPARRRYARRRQGLDRGRG